MEAGYVEWVIEETHHGYFSDRMSISKAAKQAIAVLDRPPERAAAASLTSVPRSLASGVAPVLSGYLITVSAFGWPLLLGGLLKAGYDLALLGMFSRVQPPEERRTAQAESTAPE